MKYLDISADLRVYLPSVKRKALTIVLLTMLLVFISFASVRVKALKVQDYQTVIQVEEVPITQQQIEQQQVQQITKTANVIEAQENEKADTVKVEIAQFDEPPPPPPKEDEGEEIQYIKVEIKPKVVSKPMPVYPKIAKDSGTEGIVMIEFVIDTTGIVIPNSAKVIQSRPEKLFDDAAMEAIYKWKFTPGQQRDRKVRVRWQQPIRFELKG